MVVEYGRYRIPAGRDEEFERAWSEARTDAAKPFVEQIQEMRHYELTGIGSGV